MANKYPPTTLSKQHLPCWECESSDAATLYLDGGKPRIKCYSCDAITYDDEIIEDYMSGELPEKKPTTTNVEPIKVQTSKGYVHAMEDRHIKIETAQRFGVKTLYNEKNERYARVFPYHDPNGDHLASKIKTLDKKIYCEGTLSACGLFGQHLFASGGQKYVTITEGEEDAMAVHQMLSTPENESAVVSVKTGAPSAVKSVEGAYEWLNGFENIIICFDNDKQGQEAAKAVASKFLGKAKIMKMRHKDANDYLRSGDARIFKKDWFNAEQVSVKGVYEFSELWDEINKVETYTTVPYPWQEVNDKLYGMRTGELAIIKAKPKIGKTELLREIVWHIHETTDHHMAVIFLEESVKRIAQGFMSKEMNKPIHLPDTQYKETDRVAAFKKIADAGKIHIFDPTSERTPANLFAKLQYFVNACGCKYIFLDHISMFAYKAQHTDERRFLDGFITDLEEFATKHDVHICAVMHVNDEGKTRGSRAPNQLCQAMIEIQRDKLNPDPIIANTTKVIVEENRFSGDSGWCCDLLYDRDTGRMNVLDQEEYLRLIGVEEDEQEKEVEFKDDTK